MDDRTVYCCHHDGKPERNPRWRALSGFVLAIVLLLLQPVVVHGGKDLEQIGIGFDERLNNTARPRSKEHQHRMVLSNTDGVEPRAREKRHTGGVSGDSIVSGSRKRQQQASDDVSRTDDPGEQRPKNHLLERSGNSNRMQQRNRPQQQTRASSTGETTTSQTGNRIERHDRRQPRQQMMVVATGGNIFAARHKQHDQTGDDTTTTSSGKGRVRDCLQQRKGNMTRRRMCNGMNMRGMDSRPSSISSKATPSSSQTTTSSGKGSSSRMTSSTSKSRGKGGEASPAPSLTIVEATQPPSTPQPTHRPSTAPTPSPTATPTADFDLLYFNDFESPKIAMQPYEYCTSVSITDVNDYYSRPDNQFSQQFTVETFLIQTVFESYNEPYVDPDGRAGLYAIQIKNDPHDDRLALTFDLEGRRYVRIGMDVSPIGSDMNSYGYDNIAGSMRLSVRDDPNQNNAFGGTLLDSVDITAQPGPNEWTFAWTRVDVVLDTQAASNGLISIEWDMLTGNILLFDNLSIKASDNP